MTPSRSNTSITTIAIAGLLAAVALIFSYVEVLFPVFIAVPGVKLGIANIVIIIALYYNETVVF